MRCSLVFFVFLCPAVATAQQVKLEAKHPSVGDRTSVKIESSLVLDLTKKDDNGEKRTTHSIDKTESFRQDVTAAENGQSLTLKVTCVSSQFERVDPDGRRQGNSDIHGKTFTVKRPVGKPAEITLSDGSPAIGAEAIGGWEDFAKLLPGKKVAVKEQWLIEKDVTALMGLVNMAETKSAQITCTLESHEGGKAVISLTGAVEGRMKDGAIVKVSVTSAELVFDTEKGRPVSMKIVGEFDMVKDITHSYRKPGEDREYTDKIGDIKAKSTKLEVRLTFE